eukprot:TRINITY_DN25424_c0_g1_i1.p1 TRINITY_DN25424_c0_g1~~TRINITY_DN25424_c0_g1_i1.p1  ORF type:complete len:214 (-),score=44.24 TRINITY_DN25424_c0_g1_i1:22-663(-)
MKFPINEISFVLFFTSFTFLLIGVSTRGWSFQESSTEKITAGLFDISLCDTKHGVCSTAGIDLYRYGNGNEADCKSYCSAQNFTTSELKSCNAECDMKKSRNKTMDLQIVAIVLVFIGFLILGVKIWKKKESVVFMFAPISLGIISFALILVGLITFGNNFSPMSDFFEESNLNGHCFWGFSAGLTISALILIFISVLLGAIQNGNSTFFKSD